MEVRCLGIKKNGTQCNRMGSERCFQHILNQCSICMENMSRPTTRTLGCEHTFHTRCLERWKRSSRTCPMCRAPFDQPVYRVGLNIQCIHDGTRALHTYETTNIEQIAESFGLDMSLMPRSIADITFDIESNENIHQILEALGITSFSLPNPDTVSST